MRKIAALSSVFLLLSCGTGKVEREGGDKDFIHKTLEFIILNKDNKVVELPFLYDSLSTGIPDSSEMILGNLLLEKGFDEITGDRGWGNYSPRSPRIVSRSFKKDDCYCMVNKIYYFTTLDNLYEMAERIRCSEKALFALENN